MPIWNESNALEWRRSFGPPVRPTPAECQAYRHQMNKLGRNDSALLLGSTPEIMDAAAELGVSLTVVDISEKNYKNMQALMIHEPRKQAYANKSWAEMEFRNEFHMVLGDNVLSVVTPLEAHRIIKNVHKALAPGCEWITRVMLYESGGDYASPDTLNGRIRKCARKKDVYENLYVPFLAYYKNEVKKVISKEIYGRLVRDVEKGLFPPYCSEIFRTLSLYEEEMYLVERDEFEKSIGEMFQIRRALDDIEPFSREWVIYALKKK